MARWRPGRCLENSAAGAKRCDGAQIDSGSSRPCSRSTFPELTCVDVGASYYPHPTWRDATQVPRQTRWIALETQRWHNLGYVKQWGWPCQCLDGDNQGCSREGGPQTLYVTRVDSGSRACSNRASPGAEAQRLQPRLLLSSRSGADRNANAAVRSSTSSARCPYSSSSTPKARSCRSSWAPGRDRRTANRRRGDGVDAARATGNAGIRQAAGRLASIRRPGLRAAPLEVSPRPSRMAPQARPRQHSS